MATLNQLASIEGTKDLITSKPQVHLTEVVVLNAKSLAQECKTIAEAIRQLVLGSKKEEIVRIIMGSCIQCPSKVAQHHLWIGRPILD